MMQQAMSANQVQVVVIAQPEAIDKQMKYRNMKTSLARLLIGLGIVQLLTGILCIIFQGVGVGIYTNVRARGAYYVTGMDLIGHGFWNGIMFVITGPFGIAGGIKRSRCQVVAFNVLSIISSGFAVCLFGIAIPGAIEYASGPNNCDYPPTTSASVNSYYNNRCYSNTGVAMQAMMAILGLVECITCLWSAVICCTIGACCCNCGGSCCCPTTPIQNQFLTTGQPYPGQQQIIFATQQQSASGQQPQMFISSQPLTFLANIQQSPFSPNPQQPFSTLDSQQTTIGLDPRHQMFQRNPPQSNPLLYSHQSSAYTDLSEASTGRNSYIDLYTGLRHTIVAPKEPDARGGTTSVYSDYDDTAN